MSQGREKEKTGFVDIHCHCLPYLDDGPDSMEHALALSRQMVEDGITAAIATPHQLGRFDHNNQAWIAKEAVDSYNKVLIQKNIAITVYPGVRSGLMNGFHCCSKQIKYLH